MRFKCNSIDRRKLFERLGFPGQKLPTVYDTRIDNFQFPSSPWGQNPNQTVVTATCVVKTTPLRESRRRPGTLYRPVAHRIFVVCPDCNAEIPFGRWHQHYRSNRCRVKMPEHLDEFTREYLICVLWAETHPDTEEPLDDTYELTDFSFDALLQARTDCAKFQAENAADLSVWDHPQYTMEEMGGHDFWLTRRGHGAGFWDGDWPKPQADRLTAAAKKFGDCTVYPGDDKLLYFM